jgi:hypothetical protein
MGSFSLVLCHLPGPTAVDFHRDGPTQERSHNDQQTQRQYPFPGRFDQDRLDDICCDKEFQPQLHRFSDVSLEKLIGVFSPPPEMQKATDDRVKKGKRDHRNAHDIKPGRNEFYDLNKSFIIFIEPP